MAEYAVAHVRLCSLAAVVGVLLAVKLVNESGTAGFQRFISYAGIAVAYAVVAIIVFLAIPGNPDTVPEWVPDVLVIMFRSFTVIGHFILWMGIPLGVVGYVKYKDNGITAQASSAVRQPQVS